MWWHARRPLEGTNEMAGRQIASFAEQFLARRTGFKVYDISTPMDLVAHGLGIALLPASAGMPASA
jgi:DNA-binding transcriptional LysR family regulator